MSVSARPLRRACVRLAPVLAAAVLASVPAWSGAAPSDAAPAGARLPATRVITDQCGPVIAKPDGGRWVCSFVDDFGGTTLDLGKWVVQDTRETGFKVGQTCFTPTRDNIEVRDGTLSLIAREGRTINCSGAKGWFRTRYTGGMVGTRGHFSQAFGRFEVRAKYPASTAPGLHGGFWMYPRDLTYGPWPASGEIDVAEWWSADPTRLLPTLHYNGRDTQADSGWECRVADQSSFHTYTLEWYRAFMRFSIDGTACFQRTWRPAAPLVAPQPFDKPFSMILNMGVGPASGSNKVSWRTSFPGILVVDYAKAWR